MLKTIINIFIFHIIFMYLTGVFIKGTFNSVMWGFEFKVMLVWSTILIMATVIIIYFMFKKEDRL